MTERDQTEAAFTELALRLGDVLREIPGAALSPAEAADMLVTGVHLDSRKVAEGDIFVARAGARACCCARPRRRVGASMRTTAARATAS